MGRLPLPIETQQKIRELAALGISQRGISRHLNMSRIVVENVLFPDRLKARRIKKPCARLVRMDRRELPEGCFDVHEGGREDWLTG